MEQNKSKINSKKQNVLCHIIEKRNKNITKNETRREFEMKSNRIGAVYPYFQLFGMILEHESA